MAVRQSRKRRARDIRCGPVHRPRRLRFEALEDRRLLTAVIGNNMAVGSELRNYRIAIGATAEYTAFHGGATAHARRDRATGRGSGARSGVHVAVTVHGCGARMSGD